MLYLDFDGKWLDRFRKWIIGLPDRNFKDASLIDKVGRLILIGIALALCLILLWIFLR
jgi:hypothetical protein